MLIPAQDGRRGAIDIFGLLLFSASLFELISLSTPIEEYKEQTQKKAGLLFLSGADCWLPGRLQYPEMVIQLRCKNMSEKLILSLHAILCASKRQRFCELD